MKLSRLIAAILVTGFSTLALADPPRTGEGRKRWAIISSPEAIQSGIPDLLTVDLSKEEGIELLERDEIAKSTAELELVTLQQAGARVGRLELGKLLGADILFILSVSERQRQKTLRLVVSESRFGARLYVEEIPLDLEKTEPLRKHCVATAKSVRNRYSKGIQHIVAIPDFVARNLTKDHDHLQASYAELLQQSLLALPGVAVLEIEEAQAVGRELAISGRELADRPTAKLVRGEFEMSQPLAEGALTVRLHVRVEESGGSKTFQRDAVPLDDVPELLLTEVTSLLLGGRDDAAVKPLSREQQFAYLVERANAFANLVAYRESIQLREAALLLSPTNRDQRLRLVKEQVDMRFTGRLRPDPRKDPEGWEEFYRAQLVHESTLQRHIEFLIYNRLVNPAEASWLAKLQFLAMEALVPRNYIPSDSFRAQREQLFWELFTAITKLDYALPSSGVVSSVISGRPTRSDQVDKWVSTGAEIILDWGMVAITYVSQKGISRSRGIFKDEDTLDLLAKFLEELAPSDREPTHYVVNIYSRSQQLDRFTDDQLRAFYERLMASKSPANQIIGRYGLLQMKAEEGGIPDEAMVQEADAIVKLVHAQGWKWHIRDASQKTQQDLTRRLAQAKGKVEDKTTAPYITEQTIQDSPRIRFAPLAERIVGNWDIWTTYPDALDVMASCRHIDIMREKGKVERVFAVDQDTGLLLQVRRNGQKIWVTTDRGGVRIVSFNGSKTSVNTVNDLPPHNPSTRDPAHTDLREIGGKLEVQPLEDGRALVFGRLGAQDGYRAWLGIVRPKSPDSEEYTAEVIHKFIKRSSETKKDPERIPASLFFLGSPANDSAKYYLEAIYDRESAQLVIDLKSLKVSLNNGPAVGMGNEAMIPSRYVAPKGTVLIADHVGAGIAQPGRLFVDGANRKPFYSTNTMRMHPCLLPLGDWVYQPGEVWLRCDRQSTKHEWICKNPLPYHRRFQYYGVSSHYGLVAWNRSQAVQRVYIDSDEVPADDPLDAYVDVPLEQRPQHHEAVLAITKVGGIVTQTTTDNMPRATVVILPPQWKGGDEGLKHLQKLYRVYELEILQAPVGDDGIKHVAGLAHLSHLTLNATKATDDGLAHLHDLPSLTSLDLLGNVRRRQFSDAGLRHLRTLPKLASLKIYGPGFTDTSMKEIVSWPAVASIYAMDTQITKSAVEKAQQTKPNLECYVH